MPFPDAGNIKREEILRQLLDAGGGMGGAPPSAGPGGGGGGPVDPYQFSVTEIPKDAPKPKPKRGGRKRQKPPSTPSQIMRKQRQAQKKAQRKDSEITMRLFEQNPPRFAMPGLNQYPVGLLDPSVRKAFPGEMGPGWDMVTMSPEEFQHLLRASPDAQMRINELLDRGLISPGVLDRLVAPAKTAPKRKKGSGRRAKPGRRPKRAK